MDKHVKDMLDGNILNVTFKKSKQCFRYEKRTSRRTNDGKKKR